MDHAHPHAREARSQLRGEGELLQRRPRQRQATALRRHRQPRRRHHVRAGVFRFPARQVRDERVTRRRRNAVCRKRRALRLPVHEHRARVGRLPIVPP